MSWLTKDKPISVVLWKICQIQVPFLRKLIDRFRTDPYSVDNAQDLWSTVYFCDGDFFNLVQCQIF